MANRIIVVNRRFTTLALATESGAVYEGEWVYVEEQNQLFYKKDGVLKRIGGSGSYSTTGAASGRSMQSGRSVYTINTDDTVALVPLRTSISFIPASDNVGAVTLNINGTQYPLLDYSGKELLDSDLVTNSVVEGVWDGAAFRVKSGIAAVQATNARIDKSLSTVEDVGVGRNLKVTNNAEVAGALSVTGKSTLKGDVQTDAALQVGGDFTVLGSTKFKGPVTFDNELVLNNFTIQGEVSGASLNIVGGGKFGRTIDVTGDVLATGKGTFGSSLTVEGTGSFGNTITAIKGIYVPQPAVADRPTDDEVFPALYASIGGTDAYWIAGGTKIEWNDSGSDIGGYMEIGTANNGKDPIVFRQFNNTSQGVNGIGNITGLRKTVTNELILLDRDGNTRFPKNKGLWCGSSVHVGLMNPKASAVGLRFFTNSWEDGVTEPTPSDDCARFFVPANSKELTLYADRFHASLGSGNASLNVTKELITLSSPVNGTTITGAGGLGVSAVNGSSNSQLYVRNDYLRASSTTEIAFSGTGNFSTHMYNTNASVSLKASASGSSTTYSLVQLLPAELRIQSKDVKITPTDTLLVTGKSLSVNTDWNTIYPTGCAIPYWGTTPPTGFLTMEGQSFDTTVYTVLAKAYPSGVLPDMRDSILIGATTPSTDVNLNKKTTRMSSVHVGYNGTSDLNTTTCHYIVRAH